MFNASWYLVRLGWWCVCVLAENPGQALEWAWRSAPACAPPKEAWRVDWYAAGTPAERLRDQIPKGYFWVDSKTSRLTCGVVRELFRIPEGTLIQLVGGGRQLGKEVWLESDAFARVWANGEEFFIQTPSRGKLQTDVSVWERSVKSFMTPPK